MQVEREERRRKRKIVVKKKESKNLRDGEIRKKSKEGREKNTHINIFAVSQRRLCTDI